MTVVVCLALGIAAAAAAQPEGHAITTDHFRLVLSPNGRSLSFIDRATGKDYCDREAARPFMLLHDATGKAVSPSSSSFSDTRLVFRFDEAQATVFLRVRKHDRYVTLEVEDVQGSGVDRLEIGNLPLTLTEHVGSIIDVAFNDEFAAGLIAANLQAEANGQGGAKGPVLWSACHARTGLVGAKMALIGCPAKELRQAIQDVVLAEKLPRSPVGGAWALGRLETQGSYLFSSAGEADIDDWIALAKLSGMKQLLLCGVYRFGDYVPYPHLYPNGVAGLKAVVDKIHAAGMLAGMHTHTFSIPKNCSFVLPKPDHRLADDAVLTLAADIDAAAQTIPTIEPTKSLPVLSGYFVRSGVDVRLDDEIIRYATVSADAGAFSGCQRGAYGTVAAPHAQGAKVHHLSQAFDMYVPDGDSTLMDDVAQKMADIYNACGFDLIYFDGLDGADAIGGARYAWHYGPEFCWKVWERLKRPALTENSAWMHHTWHIHSRLGAWDHPVRGAKAFIDEHAAGIKYCTDNLLPSQLGWWGIRDYGGPNVEPTTPETMDYLGAKCLGYDVALSIQNIDPGRARTQPWAARLMETIGRWERLRESGTVGEVAKARLRQPKSDFELVESAPGKWHIRPARYDVHKVTGLDGPTALWTATNEFPEQPLRVRIRALSSAAPYDDPSALVLTDFADPTRFHSVGDASGVSHSLEASSDQTKAGAASGLLKASNTRDTWVASWCGMETTFSPTVDMGARQALGMWVYGDGKSEVINFQLRSPVDTGYARAERYVVVDFTGWRYFDLIEQDGARFADYVWPYYGGYSVYRETPTYSRIEALTIYLNNLPPKDSVALYLSPVKAVPIAAVTLRDPRVSANGKSVTFPLGLPSGSYVEFSGPSDCKWYDPNGSVLAPVTPVGDVPTLLTGPNQVAFSCEGPDGPYRARAEVTVVTAGPPLEVGR